MVLPVDPLSRQAPIAIPDTGAPSDYFMRQWQGLTGAVAAIVAAQESINAILAFPLVTLGAVSSLSAERALTAGTAIGIADGGANSTVTISVIDPELTAIAGLTSAADKLPYFTGSGTAALADFTTFGRSLVDDGNATVARTTLALGNISTINLDGNGSHVLLGNGTWGTSGVSTTLTSAHILVGNATNVATDVAMSGDVTVNNAGVTAIGASKVTEAMQILSDNTTNDVGTSKHGYAPKGDGNTTKFLNANGAYSIPAGGGSGAAVRVYEASGPDTPASANFSWVNQGNATVADGTNACIITAPSAGGDALRCQVKTAPATTFNIYCRFRLHGKGVSFVQGGILVRNSTSGRIITTGVVAVGGGGHNSNAARWASATSFSADINALTNIWDSWSWLRMEVTSTTLTFYKSWDGWNWKALANTETISSYLTATGGTLDQIGFFVNPNGDAAEGIFQQFGTTAPT